jgi:hypothetical protein
VDDVGRARRDREHGVAEIALSYEDRSLLDVELMAGAGDPPELVIREGAEERQGGEVGPVHRGDATKAIATVG